jgi:hypothetical protein
MQKAIRIDNHMMARRHSGDTPSIVRAAEVVARMPVFMLLLIAAAMVAQKAYAKVLVAETIGQAYDLNSAQPLYTETHCVSDDAVIREVIYRDGNEEVIAFKALSYATGPTTPAFVQHNISTRGSVAVELQQGEVVMNFAGSDSELDRVVAKKAGATLPLVIDAGFDAFVKTNWESLLAGERKRFQFPFAAREMVVELQIASASCSYESETDQCFSLELNNWLLKMVADPIELGYDSELRRLSRFRGVSNITDADGAGMVVDILYRYSDMASVDCAPEELSGILGATVTYDLPKGVDRPSIAMASLEN